MRVGFVFLVSIIAAVLGIIAPLAGLAQSSPDRSVTNQPVESRYLFRMGRQAFRQHNYQDAQTYFTAYLKDNPDDADALFFAGLTAIGLKQYDDAARYLQAAIKNRPPLWAARKNLVIVYAAQGKWADFDRERKLIQDARASGAAGLSPTDSDIIDVIHIGSERYIVRAYDPLEGRRKTRYNFIHFGPDVKLDFWISCDSLDVDQIYFARKHPEEAAAGKRSFSLDSFTAMKPRADGKGYTQTQGFIKFYPDGEPTYETVRADVIEVLEHRLEPKVSATPSPTPSTPNAASPDPAKHH